MILGIADNFIGDCFKCIIIEMRLWLPQNMAVTAKDTQYARGKPPPQCRNPANWVCYFESASGV